MPKAIIDANTGINAVDEAIKEFYKTGYMHNHMRMYVASICCNIGQCHWFKPSKWMYAYLLDGDIASNALSWQWVAGTHSKKKYYANQNNINKYFFSDQKGSFLDVDYSAFNALPIPEELKEWCDLSVQTDLSGLHHISDLVNKTTLLYTYYNLDPYWRKDEDAQRIFLLEPSIFKKHPVDQSCIDFAIRLSENIQGMKLFVGEFDDLIKHVQIDNIRFKEHPLCKHYKGREDPREWLTDVTGYYPSFFAFWNKGKKQLKW